MGWGGRSVWLSLAAGLLFAAFAGIAEAATISGASIVSRGALVELRFKVRGAQPEWQLRGEKQHLTIDLDNTRVATASRPLAGREILPVTDVQAIATTDGDAQLVIGVKGKVDYAATLAPHELIVRFARAGTAPDIATPILIRNRPHRTPVEAVAPVPIPVVAHEPAPEPSAPRAAHTDSALEQSARLEPTAPRHADVRRPLVIIDPGHGGHDPGTLSADNLAEKDLALQIAIRLQRALQTRRLDADLTRSDDRFLTLAERTHIANRRAADLFVSIHLNSSPDSNTTGIETYYLNNTTDRATIRLAEMENAAVGDSGDSGKRDLNYILTDLRQGDKANESVALARMIEAETVAAIAMGPGVRVNALGAKQGPFYVLVGAEMPAVLVECGFLSNQSEASHLADPAYQRGLAEGIATAVDSYFSSNVAVGNL